MARFGVDDTNAIVVHEEAQSGTKDDRESFMDVIDMINNGQVSVLAVDDQARFSRGFNTKSIIADLVYAGGRFISTGEGIDSSKDNWELLVGVMELHHSTSSRETGRRVRRGIEGRILDGNGSAGDHPYGYRTEYRDSNWAEQRAAGQKPRKIVKIDPERSVIVREIFQRVADEGWSISAIARDLNQRKIPKDPRSPDTMWRHQHIRCLLDNRKFLGEWTWGVTETVRDSSGKIKKRLATKNRPISVPRPDLRMIDQDLWDRAHEQLAKARVQLGQTPARKARGIHPRRLFPVHNLSGLIKCGVCGSVMWTTKVRGSRALFCPKRRQGVCDMTRELDVARAQKALLNVVRDLCVNWPDWLVSAKSALQKTLQDARSRVPAEIQAAGERLMEVRRRIKNIAFQLADGGHDSRVLREMLRDLESEEDLLAKKLRQLEQQAVDAPDFPADEWFQEQISRLPEILAEPSPRIAEILRSIFDEVTARYVPPQHKFCPIELHARLAAPNLLAAVMAADNSKVKIPATLISTTSTTNPEISIELDSQPARIYKVVAKSVADLRAQGIPWRDLCKQLKIAPATARRAINYWKRSHLSSSST